MNYTVTAQNRLGVSDSRRKLGEIGVVDAGACWYVDAPTERETTVQIIDTAVIAPPWRNGP